MTSFSISCKASLPTKENFLILCLSRNVFILPSFSMDGIARCRILSRWVTSTPTLSPTLNFSFHCLLPPLFLMRSQPLSILLLVYSWWDISVFLPSRFSPSAIISSKIFLCHFLPNFPLLGLSLLVCLLSHWSQKLCSFFFNPFFFVFSKLDNFYWQMFKFTDSSSFHLLYFLASMIFLQFLFLCWGSLFIEISSW